MAIKANINFKSIVVPDAYISLSVLTIERDKQSMSFNALYHAVQGAESFAGMAYSCPYELEGENPYRQAYAYLKTLQEFEGFIDC